MSKNLFRRNWLDKSVDRSPTRCSGRPSSSNLRARISVYQCTFYRIRWFRLYCISAPFLTMDAVEARLNFAISPSCSVTLSASPAPANENLEEWALTSCAETSRKTRQLELSFFCPIALRDHIIHHKHTDFFNFGLLRTPEDTSPSQNIRNSMRHSTTREIHGH